MKTQIRSRWKWGVLPSLLLTTLVLQGIGETQPPPLTTGTIFVSNTIEAYDQDRNRSEIETYATLFKDGEAVRSGEVRVFGNGSLTWENMPKGVYEIQFETHGYGKVIKRVVVAPGETTPVVLAAVSKENEAMGMGPTVFDLQRKVTLLENRMAALEKATK